MNHPPRIQLVLLAPLLATAPKFAAAQFLVQPSPPIVQTPLAPQSPAAPSAPGAPVPIAPQPPPLTEPPINTPPMTFPPGPGPDIWLTRAIADIQALDKVSARVQTLTLRIGQPETFGSLTVILRNCMVRPPDQPQDSAAFLEVTDAHAAQPGFRGWMFASEPEVSMLESPIYDIRLNGCHS